MRVTVVGAGPVGSLAALMLARRGHEVTLVDRDPGPAGDGEWQRKGVMQFNLPHFFRPQVRQAICEEVPELWSAILLAGGLPATPPGFPEMMTGLQCRRATAERAIWNFTTAEPGIRRVTGHADSLIVEDGRVTGVVVDGTDIAADLVLVAGGRTSKLGDDLRAPAEAQDSGVSYAARQYRARPGVALPEWGMPRYVLYDGYLTIVFPQDAETLSALIVRPADDPRLTELRHNHVFDAAAAAIPHLAEWTDPDRFEPITDVKSGSNLLNSYRGQRAADGRVTPGVVYPGRLGAHHQPGSRARRRTRDDAGPRGRPAARHRRGAGRRRRRLRRLVHRQPAAVVRRPRPVGHLAAGTLRRRGHRPRRPHSLRRGLRLRAGRPEHHGRCRPLPRDARAAHDPRLGEWTRRARCWHRMAAGVRRGPEPRAAGRGDPRAGVSNGRASRRRANPDLQQVRRRRTPFSPRCRRTRAAEPCRSW